MKKTRLIFTIFAIVILSSLLSSCVGAGAATTVQIWPGLTFSADGQVGYVAYGNHVYAVDLKTGAEKWRYPPTPVKNLGLSAPPTLSNDGQLIAGAYNKILYSIDPLTGQGKELNQAATNRYYGGALALDQNIYAPNIDKNLYVINSSGNSVWKFTTDEALWAAPVSDGKVVYQAGMDHKIYALDPATGKVIWQTDDLGGSMPSSPVYSDGKLYVGTFNNEMLALDASNGKVLWREPTSGWVYARPALDNGVLYFGDLEGKFYALDAATGKSKWANPIQPDTSSLREISGAAAVVGDTVYFNNEAGVIYALNKANGTQLWNSLGKDCCSKDGKTTLGKLYAPIQAIGDTLYVTPMGVGPLIVALDLNGAQKWSYTPAK